MLCPKYGRQLTGSASKGRHSYYYYYHCIAACGTRYKAEEANNTFIGELQRFIPKPGVAELYRMVVKDIYSQQSGSQSNGRKELLAQIEAENNRLAKARKLLLDDAIDSGDYKTIKMECEKKLLILEGKLTGFSKPTYDIDGCVDKALNTLLRLNTNYLEADTTIKRNIIGSIYPEKLF